MLHGDFKKWHLLEELAPKPGWQESVVNDPNHKTALTVLQENVLMACEKIATSTQHL